MKGEESSSKAEQGSQTKEAEQGAKFSHTWFQGAKISHTQNQGAKSLGQRKQFSHTPISRCETNSKVRNPFSRCEFPKIQFSHTTVEGAKIFARCETVCENFAHHCSRCENFAHLISRCEFHYPKGAIFAHLNPRCEISSPRCENFAR